MVPGYGPLRINHCLILLVLHLEVLYIVYLKAVQSKVLQLRCPKKLRWEKQKQKKPGNEKPLTRESPISMSQSGR